MIDDNEQMLWKQEILRVFSVFVEICKDNGLNYYVAFGSAIGAVRHNGFIPWDDDIDVLMPRADYDRFLELYDNKTVDECVLIKPSESNRYYLSFAKLVSTKTTLLEHPEGRCVLGAFVDVFPMDGFPNDKTEQIKKIRKFDKLQTMFTYCSSDYNYLNLIKKEQFSLLLLDLFFSVNRKGIRKYLLKLMDRECREYDYDSSDYVGCLGVAFRGRGICPKKWFEQYEEILFDGIKVRICSGYDSFLRQIYGDYMQFPPESERRSQHYIAYRSFTKETIEEVLKKIKK